MLGRSKPRLWSTRTSPVWQVGQPAPGVEQSPRAVGVEAERQCVDCEVAAVEVELDAALLHRRQHGRRRVELRACGHKVEMRRQIGGVGALQPGEQAIGADGRIVAAEQPFGRASVRCSTMRPP